MGSLTAKLKVTQMVSHEVCTHTGPCTLLGTNGYLKLPGMGELGEPCRRMVSKCTSGRLYSQEPVRNGRGAGAAEIGTVEVNPGDSALVLYWGTHWVSGNG